MGGNALGEGAVGEDTDPAVLPQAKYVRVGVVVRLIVHGELVAHRKVHVLDLLGRVVARLFDLVFQQRPEHVGVSDQLGVVDVVDLAPGGAEGEDPDDYDGDEDRRRYPQKELPGKGQAPHGSIM